MTLTKEELIDGINKSLINSNQLIEEAKLLQLHKKYPRAYTLYQLSIEEVGKALLLIEFLLFDFGNKEKELELLKNYRDHKIKTHRSTGADYLLAYMAKGDLRKKILDNLESQSKNIHKINDLKNYSLYTSFIDNKFVLPSQGISLSHVEGIQFYAEIRQEATQNFFESSMEEFENLSKFFKNIDIDTQIKFTKELLNNLSES